MILIPKNSIQFFENWIEIIKLEKFPHFSIKLLKMIKHSVYSTNTEEYRVLMSLINEQNDYVLKFTVLGILSKYFDNLKDKSFNVTYNLVAAKFDIEEVVTTYNT